MSNHQSSHSAAIVKVNSIIWQVEFNTFARSLLPSITECGLEVFSEIPPNCGSQKHEVFSHEKQ